MGVEPMPGTAGEAKLLGLELGSRDGTAGLLAVVDGLLTRIDGLPAIIGLVGTPGHL